MRRAIAVFDGVNKSAVLLGDCDILDAANQIEIGISAVCGGRGLCGKCRIIVTGGAENLETISNIERLSLSEEELGHGYRLACCAKASRDGAVHVEVPSESSVERQRLQVAGIETAVSLDPMVEKHVVTLTMSQLEDPKSDVEILFGAMSKYHNLGGLKIDHSALMEVPLAIRVGNNLVTVTSYGGDEIVWVEGGEHSSMIFGLAVDIGTTKLAAYLIDLKNGKTVATASLVNPQIQFGDDIITRISYASKGERNLKQLQGIVVAAVNRLIHDTCQEAGVQATQVCDIVVVGNTAMHHIFLGINPRFLALSPYQPTVRSEMVVHSRDVGLKMNPGGYVYCFPIIAGFVGGDAVADVLATELYKSRFPALLIDIGTNTELVLSDGHKLTACSCASGPALEGACIEYGMRAETGAIEQVYINPENLDPGFTTVGGSSPRGICGSGILDVVASMLKCGIIDHAGRIDMRLSSPRIRPRNGFAEYVLAWKDETANGIDITVTQQDIQEIQLAKAAIYAAASVLMAQLGIKPPEIQQVYLAGAFGTYVDPQSALIVGMYPDIPLNRIRFVGNSAGSGARMALISKAIRTEAQMIAKSIDYIELAADRRFHEEFMNALYLPHRNVALFPTITQMLRRLGNT